MRALEGDPPGAAINRRELVRGAFATAALAAYPFELRPAPARPLERGDGGRRVVIVGAGLAGLVAGWELTRAGHDVTLLEAQTRPGGRVHTLRAPFSDGLHVDLGASELPDSHKRVRHYVDEFGLELMPWLEPRLGSLASVFHLGGRRIRSDAGERLPYELNAEEREMGNMGMLLKYYHFAVEALGDPQAAGWPAGEVAAWDRMSVADLIRSRGASPDALKALKIQFFLDLPANGVEETSALYLLRDSRLTPGGVAIHKIKGGMDRLPLAFASRLRDRIYYGARVVRIEHGPDGAEAVFEQGGRLERLRGDHLICAVPFSLLRLIEVSPPFSAAKRRVIAELPYCSNSRLFLQTRERFWIDEGLSGFGYTDLPIKYIFDSTSDADARRGMLEVYTSGPEARRFDNLSEAESLDYALTQVERVHPRVREYFEGGAVKCWDEDRWARGAYAYFRPGQMAELLPLVPVAEGRVHFAGEHASAYPHWMEGALQSGLRAAEEINEA